MVPNLSKGAGIKGTALYVLHDKRTEEERALGAELTPEHQTDHRVGMTATRNLSTDNPELAWRLMCATAENRDSLKAAAGIRAGGRETKNFCGHLSLSWELQTQPDPAEMQRAADGALAALGWDKLQALIVEHRDEEHAHCHIVVNLIDPETGRTAPNRKNDFEILQRWAHEYDRERGIEACPDRAKRMERQPDDPTPPEPAKRWLSRKQYEAVQASERAEHRTQAMQRYREAAADVREQFRPEWAAHYKEARTELRAFDRDATHRFAELANINQPDQIVDFYNKNRELIWRGISDEQRPGNSATLLTKGFLLGAIERAQEHNRGLMLEQHHHSKEALQERHTEARQAAYRAAWERPPTAEIVPLKGNAPVRDGGDASKLGLTAALAVTAAGIASYAMQRSQAAGDQSKDPEGDLAAAAERIARQPSRAANANVAPAERTEPVTGGASAKADRQQNRADEEAARLARYRAAGQRHRGIDRGRIPD